MKILDNAKCPYCRLGTVYLTEAFLNAEEFRRVDCGLGELRIFNREDVVYTGITCNACKRQASFPWPIKKAYEAELWTNFKYGKKGRIHLSVDMEDEREAERSNLLLQEDSWDKYKLHFREARQHFIENISEQISTPDVYIEENIPKAFTIFNKEVNEIFEDIQRRDEGGCDDWLWDNFKESVAMNLGMVAACVRHKISPHGYAENQMWSFLWDGLMNMSNDPGDELYMFLFLSRMEGKIRSQLREITEQQLKNKSEVCLTQQHAEEACDFLLEEAEALKKEAKTPIEEYLKAFRHTLKYDETSSFIPNVLLLTEDSRNEKDIYVVSNMDERSVEDTIRNAACYLVGSKVVSITANERVSIVMRGTGYGEEFHLEISASNDGRRTDFPTLIGTCVPSEYHMLMHLDSGQYMPVVQLIADQIDSMSLDAVEKSMLRLREAGRLKGLYIEGCEGIEVSDELIEMIKE